MKTYILLFSAIFLLSIQFSLAQESEKVFIVSPLIGDTLSLEERDYYNLLPTIDDFQWAVFYLNPDSTLDAKVTYDKNSSLQDTIINNYRSLKSLILHLNAAENPESINPVKNEDYTGNEVNISYNNGVEVIGNLLSASSSSLIIYSMNCNEDEIDINCATLIRPTDLEKLTVKSDFNLGRILYPVVTGLSAMLVYKMSLGSENNTLNNIGENVFTGFAIGCAGALVGLGLSYLFPIITSSDKEYSEPINEDDIKGLSAIARYKDFEPYYIQHSK